MAGAIEKGKNPVLTHMMSRLRYYGGCNVSESEFPKYDIDEVVIAKKCLLELKHSDTLKYNADLAYRVDKGKNLCISYVKMHLENSRYKMISREAFINRLIKK